MRPNKGRVGTFINDKWHVDARIGSGGMATVYAATHRNGHRAALKMLHAQLSRDPSTRQRFLREAYVVNQVSHPGVVRVDDDDVTSDGHVFLILELLEGETLEARRTGRGGRLPVDTVLDIADQALDALGAAHDKGIIHRDVKPDNVFLTKDGVVKLLDFGLARMKDLQGETTKTGVTIGTPEFMPPEQASGRRDDVDARSDVWGLGATIYTAITGKYVHDASDLHAQLVASATARAKPVRELAPYVPEDVAIVIDRALELERKDRWASAREMQRALRAARLGPRAEDDLDAESLTMPAAAPASLRRGSGAPVADVPSSKPTDLVGAPSSDETVLNTLVMSSSERTLEEAPPRTPQMVVDVDVNVPATTQRPTTERLTAPHGAAAVPPVRSHVVEMRSAPPPPPMLPGPGSPPRFSSAPPPAAASSPPGPNSLEQRRSARTVILVSIALIVLCASVGAVVLWRAWFSN